MDFNDYQVSARTTALYMDKVKALYPDLPKPVVEMMGLSYVALGLGESGEVQGKVKKLIRDCGGEITDDKKKEIAKELGDILWYVANMTTELGMNLNDIAQENLDKLFSRKERGVLTGSGDNR
jgi:NTP pyrophosphatase (non-canonical NTP hydrolase)